LTFPIPVNLTTDQSVQQYDLVVSESTAQFVVGMESPIVVGTAPIYEGPYTVVPEVNAQMLQTKDKKMTDNVTVTAIPYYEVSNTSGLTVYIAENLND